jgi:hypothetical protein
MGLAVEISARDNNHALITLTEENSDYSYRAFTLKNPSRVVVDVVSTSHTPNLEHDPNNRTDVIKNVRHGRPNENELRLVFDISDTYKLRSIDHWTTEHGVEVMLEAYPEDSCTPNTTGYNVCETARKISQSLAGELPMQLSRNLFLEKVMPNGRTVNIYGVFTYNESYLEEVANQSGISIEEMENYVTTSTPNIACGDLGLKPFIELGGELMYHYRFSDGTHYLSITVDECNND